MDRPMQKTVREIFGQVFDLDPARRAAFLDHACAGNADLRAEVEELLDALELANATTEDEARSRIDEPREEPAGSMVGPYKILQRIGEGGMGTVYMAEQQEPIRRRVALKIVRRGVDGKQAIARFEAERQALALMDHDNIARVLDAGETARGRPYFVMELVKGLPITEFCDKENLPIAERLKLFVPVCKAVQHAHQKGVIHRDLKPTNVLVSRSEGTAIPKVIDFGIAKATTTQLTDRTLFTEFHALLGTPEYMSPEQAEGSMDIDTRADVYALGVLLYELLVGVTPFDPRELRSAALQELLRILKEDEPPKPSTRASQETASSNEIAAHRGLEPARLGTLMRGELDWIVMRCLQKDRRERYETANALALDIERYLADEPVLASPPRVSYRVRKFVRRNKGKVLAAGLLVATLVVGAAGTGYGMLVAFDEAARAGLAEQRLARQVGIAERQRAEAVAAKQEAERLAGVAERSAGKAQRQAYASTVRLASVALDEGRAEDAARLLDGTTEALRGWEYRYLHRRLYDGTSETLATTAGSGQVFLAPDGSLFAQADEAGNVAIHGLQPRREIRTIAAYPGEKASPAFFFNGEKVAPQPCQHVYFFDRNRRMLTVGDAPLPSKVFEVETGRQVCSLEDSSDLTMVAIHPEEPWCVSRRPWIWNLESGKVQTRLEIDEKGEETVGLCSTFSADGKAVFVHVKAGGRSFVRMCESVTGRRLHDIVIPGFAPERHWAAPDGRHLVLAGTPDRHEDLLFRMGFEGDHNRSECRCVVYDLRAHALKKDLRFSTGLWRQGFQQSMGLTFGPHGRLVAAAMGDRVELANLHSGALLRTWTHHVPVSSTPRVAFADDGRTVVCHRWSVAGEPTSRTGARSGPAHLRSMTFDCSTPGDVWTIPRDYRVAGTPTYLAGDGELALLDFGVESAGRCFDARSGIETRVLKGTGVCVSTDRSYMARSIGKLPTDPNVAVIEVGGTAPGAEMQTLHIRARLAVFALAVSPASQRLAVAVSKSGAVSPVLDCIHLVDLTSGQVLGQLAGLRSAASGLQFTPDGSRIVAADGNGSVCLWDGRDGRLIRRIERDRSGVFALSPDGSLLLRAADGGVLHSTGTGEVVRRLETLPRNAGAVAFHPDGERVAVATPEYVSLWHVGDGVELLRLELPVGFWTSLTFDARGERLTGLGPDTGLSTFECTVPDPGTRIQRAQAYVQHRAVYLLHRLRRSGCHGDALRERVASMLDEPAEVRARIEALAREPDRELTDRLARIAWNRAGARSADFERMARAAVDMAPRSGFYRLALARAQIKRGRYRAAQETLQEARSATEIPPRYRAHALSLEAMCAARLGSPEQARELLARAVKEYPATLTEPPLLHARAENDVTGSAPPTGADTRDHRLEYLRFCAERHAFRVEHYGPKSVFAAHMLLVQATYEVGTGAVRAGLDHYREGLQVYLEGPVRTLPMEFVQRAFQGYRALGDWDAAEAFHGDLTASIRARHGADSTLEAEVTWHYVTELRAAGNVERAIEFGTRVVSVLRQRLAKGPSDGLETLSTRLCFLAWDHVHADRIAQAEPLFRESLELIRGAYGVRHPQGAVAALGLAYTLRERGRVEEATPFAEQALRTYRSLAQPSQNGLGNALLQRAMCHELRGEWPQARALFEECLEVRRRVLGESEWSTLNAQSKTGFARFKCGDFEGAEPLLVDAAERMKPPEHLKVRLREARARVAEFYRAWEAATPGKGYAERAGTWER